MTGAVGISVSCSVRCPDVQVAVFPRVLFTIKGTVPQCSLMNSDKKSSHIEWKRASKAWASGEGSSGVVFVSVGECTFVLKGSSQVGEELFGSQLGRRLGMRVPFTRLVKFTDDECDDIKNTLSDLSDNDEGEVLRQRFNSSLNRPFFLVMDYVDCQSLCQFVQNNPHKALHEHTHTLMEIGEVIAFDGFINNNDRIPALHTNAGNIDNVCVSEGAHIIPIDSCIVSIDPSDKLSAPNFAKYEERVREFLSFMFGSDEELIISSLVPVRDFVLLETGVSLSDSMLLTVAEGVRQKAFHISQLDINEIKDLRESCVGLVTSDWEGVWETSMRGINMDFICAMLTVYQAAVVGYSPPPVFCSLPTTGFDLFSHDVTQHNGVMDKLVDATPGVCVKDISVVTVQRSNMTGVQWTRYLTDLIHNHANQRHIDFIVLPGKALPHAGIISPDHEDIKPLLSFAKQHCVHIVCGTMREVISETEQYTSCVLLSDQGEIIGSCRQRHDMTPSSSGNLPGVFSTRFGIVGVLVGDDGERESLVEELMSKQPLVIFNPKFQSRHDGLSAITVSSQWRASVQMLEWYAYTGNINFVCADVCKDEGGGGESVLVTPTRTVNIPMREDMFKVIVNLGREKQMFVDQSVVSEGSSRDNTGVRTIVTSVMSSRQGERVVDVAWLRGGAKGDLIVACSHHVEVWRVRDSSVVFHDHIKGDIEACCAMSDGSFIACDSDGKVMKWSVVDDMYQRQDEEVNGSEMRDSNMKDAVKIPDKSGRDWYLECTADGDVIMRLASCELPHYRLQSPLADSPLCGLLVPCSDWLVMVSANGVHIANFMLNNMPVALRDLLPTMSDS